MELIEVINDYVATELLTSLELDFLEGKLLKGSQQSAEKKIVVIATKKYAIN